jgi:hypothetical protein
MEEANEMKNATAVSAPPLEPTRDCRIRSVVLLVKSETRQLGTPLPEYGAGQMSGIF